MTFLFERYLPREKCPYLEFFFSAFSLNWTNYGEILIISPYSVRMRGNTDQKTLNTDSFHAVIFKYNGYPDKFIESCIKRFFNKLQMLIVLTFLGQFFRSNDVRIRLKTCTKNYLLACAFQSKKRLSCLFKFKDSIYKHPRSHIVFNIDCCVVMQLIKDKLRDIFWFVLQIIRDLSL